MLRILSRSTIRSSTDTVLSAMNNRATAIANVSFVNSSERFRYLLARPYAAMLSASLALNCNELREALGVHQGCAKSMTRETVASNPNSDSTAGRSFFGSFGIASRYTSRTVLKIYSSISSVRFVERTNATCQGGVSPSAAPNIANRLRSSTTFVSEVDKLKGSAKTRDIRSREPTHLKQRGAPKVEHYGVI